MRVRIATPEERRRFLLQLYRNLEVAQISASYSDVHRIVERIKPKLEDEFQVKLGYEFSERHLYGIWDSELQRDIELLDSSELARNRDSTPMPTPGVKDHTLHLTGLGREALEVEGMLRRERFALGASRRELEDAIYANLDLVLLKR